MIATVSDADLDAAARLAGELQQRGRAGEAMALLNLIAHAEATRGEPESGEDEALTPEDVAALERGDADLAAGRVVPHDVVKQGRPAVVAYLCKRQAGEVDPEAAAAVEAYRQAREADATTAPADA